MTTLQRGDRAPLLVGLTLDGQPYLEQPEGALLVLVFFKESCQTCRLLLPRLENLYHAYPEPGWRLLGIGQDSLETTRRLVQELNLSFPILVDRDFMSSTAYRLTHVPTVFMIDTRGEITHIGIGFAREDLEAISHQIARTLNTAFRSITEDKDPIFRPG
ncbi:peroxiredoxin family protein [Thermoflexus sp.]|uniref:peroxiredoxin family protein n=1 Tax=Thermoflexus sp. TaxID=1969742 RepID=UPI0035E42163